MLFKKCSILSFGEDLPPKKISSDEIEFLLQNTYQKLNLPFGRLELMTGIKNRGYWGSGEKPSAISSRAGKMALESGNIHPHEIDLLINASVCRDFLEPSTASIVHKNLGLKENSLFFDLSNACLGLLNAFMVAGELIERGSIKKALIVCGENSGPLIFDTIDMINTSAETNRKNLKKYIANFTIGSGGVAFILGPDESKQNHAFMGYEFLSDSSGSDLCQGGGTPDGLMMETDSEELLQKGISLAKKNWEITKNNVFLEESNIDFFIPHQVGQAHEMLLIKNLNLDPDKTVCTYPFLGNTGSSAIGLSLIHLAKQNKIKTGNILALLGIGSGLSSMMMGIKW